MKNKIFIMGLALIGTMVLGHLSFTNELDDEGILTNTQPLDGTMVVRIHEATGEVSYLHIDSNVDLRGNENLISIRDNEFQVASEKVQVDELDRDSGTSSFFYPFRRNRYSDHNRYRFWDGNRYPRSYGYGGYFYGNYGNYGNYDLGSYYYGGRYYQPYYYYNYGGYNYNCYNPDYSSYW